MFTQKSVFIFHSVQEIRPFSLFQNLVLGKASTDDKCHFAIVSLSSEFEPRQKLIQSQMSFEHFMGYILSISTRMQNFITLFHSVQEIAPLSLFQNLALGKASTNDKCHFAIELDLVNINVSAKFYQNISNGLRVKFHCFQNLNLGKTSTNPKCHLTISWDTSCINVYAKFHYNIPLSSRDRAIFTFSEFGARQGLNR